MAKKRYSLALSPEAYACLSRSVSGKNSVSAYLDQVILERWAAWQRALAALSAAGWSRLDVWHGCCALAGAFVSGYPTHEIVRSELRIHWAATNARDEREAPALEPQLLEPLERGDEAAELLCGALALVAREFWADNPALLARLEAPEGTA